jgi:tRNA(adenine34) deaminase
MNSEDPGERRQQRVTTRSQDEAFMQEALEDARRAAALGEVPVGAVAVLDGQIIGRGYNRRERDKNPLLHAEIIAVEEASAAMGAWRLVGVTLYVTLEPCLMCAGAMVLARVERLVYGAADPKAGAVASLFEVLDEPRLNHHVDHVQIEAGVLADECSRILSDFFRALRAKR